MDSGDDLTRLDLLAFELCSAVAVFRRSNTNVTSLTYHFPPRNTIVGVLAAVLGKPRDSYYDEFSRNECKIAVQVLEEPRKLWLTFNYVDTGNVEPGSPRAFKEKPRQQILTELLVSSTKKFLSYRVYIFHKTLQKQLYDRLSNNTPVFPIALGPAYCLGFVNNVVMHYNVKIERLHQARVNTVVPEREWSLVTSEVKDGAKVIIDEALPPEFAGKRHTLSNTGGNYFFEATGKPLTVASKQGKGEVFFVDEEVGGVFL